MDKLKLLKKAAKPPVQSSSSTDNTKQGATHDEQALLTANKTGEIVLEKPQIPSSQFDSVSMPNYATGVPPPGFPQHMIPHAQPYRIPPGFHGAPQHVPSMTQPPVQSTPVTVEEKKRTPVETRDSPVPAPVTASPSSVPKPVTQKAEPAALKKTQQPKPDTKVSNTVKVKDTNKPASTPSQPVKNTKPAPSSSPLVLKEDEELVPILKKKTAAVPKPSVPAVTPQISAPVPRTVPSAVTPAAPRPATHTSTTIPEQPIITLQYTPTERVNPQEKLSSLISTINKDGTSVLSTIMAQNLQVSMARAQERSKVEETAVISAVEPTSTTLGQKLYSAMGLNPMLVDRGQLETAVGVPVSAIAPTAIARQREEEHRLEHELEEEMRREYEERVAEMRALWLRKHGVKQDDRKGSQDPDYEATMALVRAAAKAEGVEDVNLNAWCETGTEKERLLREKMMREAYNKKVAMLKQRIAEVGITQAKQEYIAAQSKGVNVEEKRKKNVNVKGANAFSVFMGADSDDDE